MLEEEDLGKFLVFVVISSGILHIVEAVSVRIIDIAAVYVSWALVLIRGKLTPTRRKSVSLYIRSSA